MTTLFETDLSLEKSNTDQQGISSSLDRFLSDLFPSPSQPRTTKLYLDVRPTEAFAAAHIAHSVHIYPLQDLKSRYSYLPPRGVPFIVFADGLTQVDDVRQAFANQDGVQLIFLVPSTFENPQQPFQYEHGSAESFIDSSLLFQAVERLGLLRCNSLGDKHVRFNSIDDYPALLFQPSNAVKQITETLEKDDNHVGPTQKKTILDLGCGAARDLAWILDESRKRSLETSVSPHNNAIVWEAVGVDNWKAALDRAETLMQDLNLFSNHPSGSDHHSLVKQLVWAKCTDDGFLQPLAGKGKGRSIQIPSSDAQEDQQVWRTFCQTGLSCLVDGTSQPIEPSHPGYDLVLSIRFFPRPLMSRLCKLVRKGGQILVSHFTTISDEERERLVTTTTRVDQNQCLIIDYDSPPPEGRLHPGELQALVQRWNSDSDQVEWQVEEDVLEPIEDGRIIRSVVLKRIR